MGGGRRGSRRGRGRGEKEEGKGRLRGSERGGWGSNIYQFGISKPAFVVESNQGTTMYKSNGWNVCLLQPGQVASTIHRYPFALLD